MHRRSRTVPDPVPVNAVKFRDLRRNINRHVVLIGGVVESSIPRKCKGTDYFCCLKLIDETQQVPELGVAFFMSDIHSLPHLRSAKDIIVLKNVLKRTHEDCKRGRGRPKLTWEDVIKRDLKERHIMDYLVNNRMEWRSAIQVFEANIQEYKQQPCVLFKKKDSSFALYDGNNFREYQAFIQYNPLDCNPLDCRELIRQLREWCLQFTFDAGVTTYVRELRNVDEEGYFDLVCKATQTAPEHVWILYVWDGPALSINTRVVDEQRKMPLQVEEMPLSLDILRKFSGVGTPLSLDILRKFPGVGTILRIVAHISYENLGEHFQHVGIWATIRNVSFKHFTSKYEKLTGLWIGCLNTNTKIRLLSENDASVTERKKNFNYRRFRRMPSSWSLVSEFLTATASNDNVFATLMDLSTWPHMVDHKFMSIVRLVAVYPFSIQGRYNIQMTLDDPTARLHGLLGYEEMRDHDAIICNILSMVDSSENLHILVPRAAYYPLTQ